MMRKSFAVAAALALLVMLAHAQPQTSKDLTSATCTSSASSGCLYIDTSGLAALGIQITNTFVGTVQFEQTLETVAAPTFVTLPMTPCAGGADVTSTTGTGCWKTSVTTKTARVRVSAYTSGTVSVSTIATVSSRGGGASGVSGGSVALSGSTGDWIRGDGSASRTMAAGTVTASTPWTWSQTWNAATTFYGLVFDLTLTSANDGYPIQVKRGGVEQFSVRYDGLVGAQSISATSIIAPTVSINAGGSVRFSDGTDFAGSLHRVTGGGGGLRVGIDAAGWNELQARDVKLVPNAVAQPACVAGIRGTLWYTSSAGGVPDVMEVCAKSTLDVYAWRSMATIP